MKTTSSKVSILLLFSLLLCTIIAPPSYAQWAATYGVSGYANASSIQQTTDGGYIVAGYTYSFGSGAWDIWVLKLDSGGNLEWQKTYGGSGYEFAESIQQTRDGGYIVAGYTWSFGAGFYDFWVLKLDSDGNVEWQKAYGGSGHEYAGSIQQTSDGGYILAGSTTSFGAGGRAFWVLKLDSGGNVEWQKAYGGSGGESANSIQQTTDGGYVVAGGTGSFGDGYNDMWVLKLDSDGNVQWQKTYGGPSYDNAHSIQQTADGGYIVAGSKSFGVGGPADFWVLKLDSDGNVEWQKAYGGPTSNEYAHSIQQTTDGGYIVAGYTAFFNIYSANFWVLKLDSGGNVQWQKSYGGSEGSGLASSIQQTSDSGYIVTGGVPIILVYGY